MTALPAEADVLVARIEALLDQAEALAGGSDEAAYALRETRRRYLPDTVGAYSALPPARRDAAATAMLVEQLTLLERATAQRLEAATSSAREAMAANGAFLTERFGASDSLPPVPAGATDAELAPAILMRRALARIASESSDGAAVVAGVAERLAAAFPAITSLRRSGFLGRGPVIEVTIEVRRRDDALRYILARTPAGGIDATVTRLVRNVALKRVACDVEEWIRGLAEDLAEYVTRQTAARETLVRVFGGNPG